jgi:hypothetical protein
MVADALLIVVTEPLDRWLYVKRTAALYRLGCGVFKPNPEPKDLH